MIQNSKSSGIQPKNEEKNAPSLSLSLATKLVVVVSIISIISSLSSFLFLSYKSKQQYNQKADELMKYLGDSIRIPLWNLDDRFVKETCSSFAKNEMVVLLNVKREDGEMIFMVGAGDENGLIKRSSLISHKGVNLGFVELGLSPREYTQRNFQALLISIFTLAAVIAVLIVATRFIMNRMLKSPLDHLLARIEEISKGDYTKGGKIFSSTYQELDSILFEFNRMAEQVNRREKSLTETNKLLSESEEKYRRIFESIEEGYLLANTEGKIISANPAAAEILRYDTADELIGKNIARDVYANSEVREVLKSALAEHKRVDGFQLMFRRKDGLEIVSECNIHLINNKSGEPIFIEGTFRDITKRKKAEKKLLEYQEHLEELVKERTADLTVAKEEAESANRAKSEFLANMSHEIRTPLNAVTGFSELLSSLVSNPKEKSYLDAIKTAGKSLLTLINDILDLSKIEAGMMEIVYAPLTPRSIFKEIEQIFKVRISGKNLQFNIDIDENLPTHLILDETRLRQVLLNLVGNAVKFTDNGFITLSAKRINNSEDQNMIDILISVEDSGIGISKEYIDHVFESFKQPDELDTKKYGGTGLGLHISRKLVEAMNGEISVASTRGKGSTFKVILKNVVVASEEKSPVVEEDHFDVENTVFEKAKVLVVDDVKSNLNFLIELLTKVNLDVLTAENGQEALLIVQESRPDLIVMDIRMPVMDGIQATGKLKSDPKTQAIPIIGLTASTKSEERSKILEQGFDAYLTKPVRSSHLFAEFSRFIPRTIKAEEPSAFDKHIDNPASTNINIPAELLSIFNEEILPECLSLKKFMVISDIKQFGDRLERLGKEYKIGQLIDSGRELNQFIDAFDIGNIKIALEKLPQIIEYLTETGRDDNDEQQ